MKYYPAIIIITMISTSSVVADENYSWDQKQCNKTQMTLDSCSGEELNHYEHIMNEMFEKQMDYLQNAHKKEKEEARSEYPYNNAAYLQESQNAWVGYRDATCKYESKSYENGSIYGYKLSKCKTNLTKQRIQILKEYISCRENGCII